MNKTTLLLLFLIFITSFAQANSSNYSKKVATTAEATPTIQITFGKINNAQASCIPNTILSVANPSGLSSYQWYFNNVLIPSATADNYTPTQAGYYYVTALRSPSAAVERSADIPVSICPLDTDHDGINNNVDRDLDNDGIINSFEGMYTLAKHTVTSNGSEYTDITNGNGAIIPKPLFGFVSSLAAGRSKFVTYDLHLNSPTHVILAYLPPESPGDQQIADPSEYINSRGDFTVRVPEDKTLTILNPNNALLIDTNYDGMYESGVKEFSSFEIRFRVNNPSSPAGLRPGTPFSISSYYTDFISYTHRNLSDTEANKTTFVFTIPLLFDVDSDGIPDLEDLDSDNDGIPDQIEMRGQDIRTYSGIDVDKNGLDDAFMPIEAGINTDGTHPYDYYVIDRVDSDSDNDGIYDLVESGNNAIDANHDGVIDGSPATFGRNGLLDSLETFPDSGILNYTIADTDADGMANYIDLDSDGDSCNDVTDAGFTDHNNDGLLGNTPLTSDLSGIVTSAIDGYVTPNSAYLISGKIQIASQPTNQSAYEGQSTVFTIATNPINGYQWQFSTDGIIWTNIADGSDYTGSATNSLAVKNLTLSMQNYKYRVVLSKIGNLCGLISHEASLTIQASPITSPQSLIQCDDSAGGMSTFNLTERNSSFSTNHSNELFTYYTTEAAATAKDIAFLINDPIAYRSTTGSVWVRIENASSFFSIGELKLMVSTTTIPSTFNPTLSICDDYLDDTNDDQDGIATFDFSSVSDDLKALLPAPSSLYSIAYYQTEGDALSEINPITNTTNYRNTAYPNQQKIWVRIENILDNSCYGLGENLTLKVKAVPNVDSNAHHNDDQLVCSNLSSFFVTLDAGIKDNTPATDYTYVWKKDGGILADQTQSSLEVNTEGIYSVEVTSHSGCSKTREIKVSTSNLAKINQITVENVNESNTATIAVEVTGPGAYQYSLDDPNGPFQTSNVFENVSLGIHEVYVNDQNGCGIISKSIAVIGAPKFFTPNADGYNDYWNVRGLDTDQNKNAFIYIYDRYGKLLKQLKPSDIGWDGTFLGKMLPASDYWYTTVFENGSQTKGHFSLKR